MKKRVLSIFLALVMVLSLMPTMSFAASAEEPEERSEVITFEKGSAEVESPHFILSAGQSEYYGWFVDSGDNKIVIDAKEPNIVITSIETFVGGDGDNNPDIVYSSGEKVETGAVKNGSTVHVKDINSSSLEITSSDGVIAFQTFVVRYIVSDTWSHTHNFTGRFRDNGDGTHSQKCANCYTYGEAYEHTYRPVSKVSDNPLTYTAKCTDCSSRIDNFQIDAISFDYTDWADYGGIGGVGVGDTLKRGTKLRAVYAFGDYNMIVYIDGVRAATVVGGQFWELPQCVRCTDYDTNWLQPWESLEIWFETVCDYTLATCDSPSVCMYCGRTVAEAPGHPWKSATCTETKICLDCGRTEGNPLGHKWKDATCTAPKTCSRCGLTEGDMLEHTYDVVDNSIKCTACGKLFVPEVVDTKISYTDRTWNEEDKKVNETVTEREGIIFVDENTTMIGNGNWYVVNANVTNHNRIKVGGTANLILCDGFTLDAAAGINVAKGNTLNIYGQSADSGKLTAVGTNECAGIGSNGSANSGTVNIYGGTVLATGGGNAAGIGGGPGKAIQYLFSTSYTWAEHQRLVHDDPAKPYNMKGEMFFSDADYVTHLFFPWDAFYQKLPAAAGTEWRFECMADGYSWGDPVVGDPEFYAAKLAPLEAALKAEAAKVKPEMSDDEVNEVYEKGAKVWIGLDHVVDGLRQDWLREKFVGR